MDVVVAAVVVVVMVMAVVVETTKMVEDAIMKTVEVPIVTMMRMGTKDTKTVAIEVALEDAVAVDGEVVVAVVEVETTAETITVEVASVIERMEIIMKTGAMKK